MERNSQREASDVNQDGGGYTMILQQHKDAMTQEEEDVSLSCFYNIRPLVFMKTGP